jgi:menaquinone-dependent protoporphyrinogen oxidase
MKTRILVAHASKHGATAEIAEAITETLRESGLAVDVLPVEQVEDLTLYRALVLGSAVYAGQWRQEVVEFLEARRGVLATMPVWLFSSGPTGEGDPLALVKGWKFPEAQKPLVDHIKPRDIAVFHGELDMHKLNFAEKLIVRGVKAPVGDFRDWEAITGWAKGIAETLRKESTPTV